MFMHSIKITDNNMTNHKILSAQYFHQGTNPTSPMLPSQTDGTKSITLI